jgi:N-acetylmuramoyl-L-alanine amidase
LRMKILIDPGHGGKDSGAVGNGYAEKDIVLEAALYIGGRLQCLGAEVRYTRTGDTNPGEPQDRGKLAEGCDYFLSLHCNGSKNPAAHGSECWCNAGEGFAYTESRFAEELGRFFSWRGVKSKNYTTEEEISRPYDSRRRFTERYSCTDWYGVLRGCESVGVSGDLLEMFFISCKEDVECYLLHKREIWEAIVRAVCESYGVAYAGPVLQPPAAAGETVPKAQYEALAGKVKALAGEMEALAEKVKMIV